MVACKTVGEYKWNQEKKKWFCLEEKAKQAKEEEETKFVQPQENGPRRSGRTRPPQPASPKTSPYYTTSKTTAKTIIHHNAKTPRDNCSTTMAQGRRHQNCKEKPAQRIQYQIQSSTENPKQKLTTQESYYTPAHRKVKA